MLKTFYKRKKIYINPKCKICKQRKPKGLEGTPISTIKRDNSGLVKSSFRKNCFAGVARGVEGNNLVIYWHLYLINNLPAVGNYPP